MKYEQKIDDFLFERSYTGWRLKNGSLSLFLVIEQKFSKLPYKREKKFPTQIN